MTYDYQQAPSNPLIMDILSPSSYAVSESANQLSLGELLATVVYKHNLSYPQYQLLSSWLGCYQYIIPQNRTLYPTPPLVFTTRHQSFKLWLFLDLLETSYTYKEQENIWKHIHTLQHS
jgi:hypothetical protein